MPRGIISPCKNQRGVQTARAFRTRWQFGTTRACKLVIPTRLYPDETRVSYCVGKPNLLAYQKISRSDDGMKLSYTFAECRATSKIDPITSFNTRLAKMPNC